jgi:hypothetical protein
MNVRIANLDRNAVGSGEASIRRKTAIVALSAAFVLVACKDVAPPLAYDLPEGACAATAAFDQRLYFKAETSFDLRLLFGCGMRRFLDCFYFLAPGARGRFLCKIGGAARAGDDTKPFSAAAEQGVREGGIHRARRSLENSDARRQNSVLALVFLCSQSRPA